MKRKLLSLILAASMVMGTATDVYAVSDITITAETLDEDQDEFGIEIVDDAEESTEDSTEEDVSEDSLVIIDDADDDSASTSSSDEAIIESSEDASSEASSDEDEISIFDEDASDASSEESSDESDIASSEDSINPEDIVLNYHDIERDEHFEGVLEGLEDTESYDAIVNETYPAKYITSNLPNLRDQNPYGSCWAHSEMALAEISLMKKGIVKTADMSEVHTAYFTYHSVTDPLGGTAGDSNGIPAGSDNFLDLGGNIQLGCNVLSNWMGAADESVAPYKNAAQYIRSGLASNLAYKDVAHLTNYYMANYSTSAGDLNAVKKLIVDYGAVGISYYHSSYSGIYNSAHNSYYNKNASRYSSNHAVTVVGWDDNFSKYNFTNTPAGNGAWLVRNSWTTRNNEYSLNGYFWMSYYEPSIGGNTKIVMAMDYGPSNNYANNYQYDGSMLAESIYGSKFANIFTAHSGSATETLSAVSFMTPTSNTKYTVKVYKNVNGTNPESGSCVATMSGSQSYAGYYTIPLSKPVVMNKGTKFSVVVELAKASGGSAYMGVEGKANAWFTCNFKVTRGQSFVYSGGWKDMVDRTSSYGNLKIKAFTNNGGSAPTPPAPGGTVVVTLNPNGSKAKVKTVKIKNGKYSGLSKLSRTGYTFQGWWTAVSGGRQVKNSDPLASNSNHTLYARWAVNTYTVTFNGNGATSGSMGTAAYRYDTNNGFPRNNYAKYGYTFQGWSKSKSGKPLASIHNLSAKNGAKITLYAQWKILSYDVAFDTMGGNKIATKNVKFNVSKKSFGTVKKPSTPKRKGYTFVNWYTDRNCRNVYNFNSQVTRNITLYAGWRANTYTVTFNANGGQGKTTTMTCTYDRAYNLPGGFSKYGYNFAGWGKAKGGKTLPNILNLTDKNNGKVTLYAHWNIWTHNVYFNSMGGSAVKTKTVKFNPSKKTWGKVSKPSSPKRKGFKFTGWFTDKSCRNAYNFKNPVNNNITLYAGWTRSSK